MFRVADLIQTNFKAPNVDMAATHTVLSKALVNVRLPKSETQRYSSIKPRKMSRNNGSIDKFVFVAHDG